MNCVTASRLHLRRRVRYGTLGAPEIANQNPRKALRGLTLSAAGSTVMPARGLKSVVGAGRSEKKGTAGRRDSSPRVCGSLLFIGRIISAQKLIESHGIHPFHSSGDLLGV